jgi:crotonobetainyl-CoA:carnitine CoA-transferase CaiB-like acyl-CoA transferase
MALLDGLRVLDLTMWRPGPYATQLLAQLGADVIKVEPPGGEPMRAFRGHFDLLNQHKRSLALNLKKDAGRARCLALAREADAFVEGYRPGVADRLGVGYGIVSTENPGIVYCSLSGFGAGGPLSAVPGHDINYRAYAAALPADARSPGADELPVADMAAATMAAFAITAACLKARVTGAGDHVDLAMADVLANWIGTVPTGASRPDGGGPVPGYGVYTTRDGKKINLGVVSEQRLWAATCRALGLGAHESVPPPGAVGPDSDPAQDRPSLPGEDARVTRRVAVQLRLGAVPPVPDAVAGQRERDITGRALVTGGGGLPQRQQSPRVARHAQGAAALRRAVLVVLRGAEGRALGQGDRDGPVTRRGLQGALPGPAERVGDGAVARRRLRRSGTVDDGRADLRRGRDDRGAAAGRRPHRPDDHPAHDQGQHEGEGQQDCDERAAAGALRWG